MVISVMPISPSTRVTGTRPEPFSGEYTSFSPAVLHKPGRTLWALMFSYSASMVSWPMYSMPPCSSAASKSASLMPAKISVACISA